MPPNPQSEIQNPHSLILPRTLADAIIAHARAGKPEEVCGLVRGRAGRATELAPAANVAPDRLLDYVVDPAALLAPFDWEDAGDELIAIYHSHPFSLAYPSGSDALNAHYPDTVYLICSLADNARPALNGYFLREAAGEFSLDEVRAELDFYETRPGRWVAYIAAAAPLPPALTDIRRPPGLALYLVSEQEGSSVYSRAVSVQPVEVRIESI